jgi:hypothetical protein
MLLNGKSTAVSHLFRLMRDMITVEKLTKYESVQCLFDVFSVEFDYGVIMVVCYTSVIMST